MTKADEYTTGFQKREFQVRAESDSEKREIEGISVPFGQVADLGFGITEEVRKGAVDDDGALIFYRHTDPIGLLARASDTDAGRKVVGRVSKTTLGDDALTLARDGVLANWSIGFEPVESIREDKPDGSIHITHTKIRVREISLVPLPAYEGAKVTNVREGVRTKEGNTMTDTQTVETPPAATDTPPAGAPTTLELREAIDDLERRFGTSFTAQIKKEPEVDTRSMGHMLKALENRETRDATLEYMNRVFTEITERAYTGGTVSDAIMRNTWVGDLTRIVDEAAPLLDLFAKGDLPETGNVIEFGRLKTNTVVVQKQAAEGDNLAYGKVAVETDTADVDTYGGYGELSFQAVKRSSVNLLNTLLLAQGIAAGKAMNTAMRALFVATFNAQKTAGNTVGVPATGADYQDWLGAIVDAAVKFEALGLPITGMVTNTQVFKALGQLTASDGRPVLLVRGDGNNNIGEFNPVGLAGNLAGVVVRLDAGLPATQADGPDEGTDPDAFPIAAFVNKNALRAYVDPVSRLQDENIINLTKQYSVYRFAAFADEIPQAVVPVAFA